MACFPAFRKSHESHRPNLGQFLHKLRDAGNSVIIVEHDEGMIRLADEIIDLGPGAGKDGGKVIYSGPAKKLFECKNSLTAKYLKEIFPK